MKIIWSIEDIQGGLYIIRNSSPKNSENLSFAATVSYKIGWNPTVKGLGNQYGLISFLTDGMYMPIGTKEELVKHLNETYNQDLNENMHGYRPMTKQEIINIINHTSQGFI